MAKDLQDLKQAIENARREIEAQLPAIAENVANSTKTIAERNINDFGFGAEYSQKQVPAFFFYDKALNQAGRDIVKKKIEDNEGLSWGGFREAQGLPADHVTLNYSNRMWGGIVIIRSEKTGQKFIAYLGHTNREGQDKMNWNYERYGNFIIESLTFKDKKFLTNLAGNKVTGILKQYLK